MSTALSVKRNLRSGMALVQAAGAGDFDSVTALISAGVDVNSATDHGMTALMSAAAGGHQGLVNHLLARGANINAKRFDGLDALALAVFFGHPEVVSELLGGGADPQAKTRFGTSLAAWATARGFSDIARILTEVKTAKQQSTKIEESNPPTTKPIVQEPISSEVVAEEGVGYDKNFRAKSVSRITIPIHNDSTHDGRTNSINTAELPAETRYSAEILNNETYQERKPIAWLIYMTSDWLRLTVVTLAVLLASSLGTLAILQLSRLNEQTVTPAIVSQPATSDFQRFDAPKGTLSPIIPSEEFSSSPEAEDSSGDQSRTSIDAKRSGKTGALPSADSIENPSSFRRGKILEKSAEGVADRSPKQATPLNRDSQVVSNPALRLGSVSSPAKKISPATTGLALGESDVRTRPTTPPTPSTIEIQRPRRTEREGVPPVPAATPVKSRKTKVIQWP